MPKTLILAEKPSVARDIAQALGVPLTGPGPHENDQYVVTSSLGHLVELAPPETYDPTWKAWQMGVLPMVPTKFQLAPIKNTAAYLSGLKRLLSRKDVNMLVNACDAGREGELIFRYIYRHTGCQKPVKRLWLSENTPSAVRAAFGRLRSAEEMVYLGTAAELRACSDWLVGINCTRAYTVRHAGFGNVLSVGRVQTPTLALLVERERAIQAFVSVPYWQVVARFSTAASEVYEGTWTSGDQDRFSTLAAARQIQLALAEIDQGQVVRIVRKDNADPPPQLYNLTTLQRDANKRYGLTAKQTLDAAQALYERHKLITYPRTDSRHLTTSLAGTLADRIQAVSTLEEFTIPPITTLKDRRFVDDSKVTDHHAIIPTTIRPDLGALTQSERQVYDLVARRFLAAFFPSYRYRQMVVTTAAAGEPFVSKGRTDLQVGWRIMYGRDDDEEREPTLPTLAEGQMVALNNVEVLEKATKPPKRYTEASLLGAMENAGRQVDNKDLADVLKDKAAIGTPATRAAIIERLLQVGYIVRDKKDLVATPKGESLLDLVDERLKSPELTAQWEQRLLEIESGRARAGGFWTGIVTMTREIIEAVRGQEKREVPGQTVQAKRARRTRGSRRAG